MRKLTISIGATFLLTGCLSASQSDISTVETIIDPLTFISSDGEIIRMIGIRSPLATKPVQCFGKEALQAAESLIGKTVRLEEEPLFTIAEDGAKPRYVFLTVDKPTGSGSEIEEKEIMVNEKALEMGTAFPLVSEEMIYGSRMLSAAKYASATKKGLWVLVKFHH